MQGAFKTACEEHKINPVSESKLTDMKGGEAGEALRFTIETEVDPPIEIKGYDKLKIKAKPAKVTDSTVDEAFDEFIDRYAEFDDVSRPAKKGDYLRIKYKSVAIDGVERPDLKDRNPEHPIELGGEGVFKEFDKGLAGKSAGDETEISVKFPKDYADAGVAGKVGVFNVEVLSVQEKRLPEVNEEFLKKIGDFPNADALKGEFRKNIEARELRKAKEAAQEEAIEELIKENPIQLAPATVDSLAKRLMDDYLNRQEPKTAEAGLSEEQQENFYGIAARMLKRMKIIDYVAEKEKIKAAQEEVDNEIMMMAQAYGQDFNALKQKFRQDGVTNRIRVDIRERKTLDFLIGEGGSE